MNSTTVLVTGGTSGLGRVIAGGFAATGADVIICSRSQTDCSRVALELSTSGPGTCTGIACDLNNLDDIAGLAGEVGRRGGALNTLINNAGAIAPGPLAEVREEAWDTVLDVNLKAVFFMTQRMTPYLRNAASVDRHASIINIGSFAGGRVGPRPHHAYTAAKAALRYLTQSLAKELASEHINVNAIALGVFPEGSAIMQGYDQAALTQICTKIPAGRLGEARDIIALTQFLASAASSYITGATIPLDGGMHI